MRRLPGGGNGGDRFRIMNRHFTAADEARMKRALALARRGQGSVEPNPMVGCVLVRSEAVVGEGWHRRFGGPHAEVNALRAAGAKAKGATAYVTLEPCCHQGKTPPCTTALIGSGVQRVIASITDPFPEVAGKGLHALAQAGIRVDVGLLEEEAAEVNAPFLTRTLLGRPYVIAKWAQSADGKTATRTGDSKWITGGEARQHAHRVRARVDAIIVGSETAVRDDPLLTARNVPVRRRAVRIVLDNRLRISPSSQLVQTAAEHVTYVFTTAKAAKARTFVRAALERQGVRVLTCREKAGRVGIRDALRRLFDMGCTNVLAEGGGRLVGSLMDAGVVDEVHVYTAPIIIGGESAPTGCGGRGIAKVASALRGRVVAIRRLGDDALTVLRLTDPRKR